jgi:hypothetical protein
MELRFLTRRELPMKYCADLQYNLLYSLQEYFKVTIENRFSSILEMFLQLSGKSSNLLNTVLHGYIGCGGFYSRRRRARHR